MAFTTQITGGVSASSLLIDVPADAALADGDYRLMFMSVSNTTVLDPGTGWALVANLVVASTRRIYVYSDEHSDAAPAGSTFTLGANNNHGVVWVAVRGENAAAPVDVGPTAGSNTLSQTAIVAPTVTTTQAATLLLTFHAVFTNTSGATLSTPTGMTSVVGQAGSGTAGHNVRLFKQDRPTAGATGTRTSTSSASQAWGAVSVALAPGLTVVGFLPFFT